MRVVRQELRAMAAALLYFTRLPCPVRVESADLRRGITWFPLVGALVGLLCAAVWWGAAQLWPAPIAAGLAVAAGIWLTGAMHEDGWADMCDGFGGGTTRERVLTIMQDSRIGAFGVIGLILVVGLKWQALSALPAALVPVLLLASHTLSRGAAAVVMAWLPYARAEHEPSKARPMVRELGGPRLGVVLVTALLPLAALPLGSAIIVLVVGAATWGLVAQFRRRLGGYTGDCLGAVQQVTEVLILLVALALR